MDKITQSGARAPDAEQAGATASPGKSKLALTLAEAERLREALDHLPVYIYIQDAERRFAYANRSALGLFGCSAAELLGSDGSRFLPAPTVVKLRESEDRALAGAATSEEIEIADASGRRRVYWDVKAPIHDEAAPDAVAGLIGMSTEITVRKDLEAKLEWQAQTDLLTELPNRSFFLTIAAMEFSRARRYRSPLTMAMVGVDRLKLINDTYGQAVGDKSLREVARACRQALRDSDLLARVGADKFAMLLPETAADQALVVADRLRRILAEARQPAESARPEHFSTSLGIASLLESDEDGETVLARADQALHEDRRKGNREDQATSVVL